MTSPVLILQARAEARALLWQVGEYPNLLAATEPLWRFAHEYHLIETFGEAAVRAIIDQAFHKVTEDG